MVGHETGEMTPLLFSHLTLFSFFHYFWLHPFFMQPILSTDTYDRGLPRFPFFKFPFLLLF